MNKIHWFQVKAQYPTSYSDRKHPIYLQYEIPRTYFNNKSSVALWRKSLLKDNKADLNEYEKHAPK